jgi:Sulfotransferase domain
MVAWVRPNFLIIGAARSGTTALARFLSSHPNVVVSSPKEPHFLALGGTAPQFTGPGDSEMMNRVAVTTLEGYLGLFAGAGGAARRGEGSVSTLYYAGRSIPHIDAHCEPGTRLIAILRDPVERAHSAYLYLRARGHERCDTFEEALAAEDARVEAGWHHMWHYVRMSRYGEQLQPFVEHFGRDRLLVVRHDDLELRAVPTLRRVFDFLELEPVSVDTSIEINRSGLPRSRAVHHAMKAIRSVEPVRRAVRAVTSQRLRENVRSANLAHPPLEVALRSSVREALASDGDLLAALNVVDVTGWR